MTTILITIIGFAVAFFLYAVILNYRPKRCPICNYLMVFAKTTGPEYDSVRNEDGGAIETVTPCVCTKCGSGYVLIWKDHEGSRTESKDKAPPALGKL